MDTGDVARRIVRAMESKGYRIDRGPGQVNIVYLEGATFKEQAGVLIANGNGNKPNEWNDVRAVLQFDDDQPSITDYWPATTEPGTRYTMAPINEDGGARITLGQQSCWQVGLHRGYEALAQTGNVVMVTRDANKDFQRAGDKVTKGFYGINQHHGFDAPTNDVGPHSAGCLVGRTIKGHQEFMALVKTDPRYLANRKFVFTTTIIEASEILVSQPAPPSRANAKAPAKMILHLTAAAVRKMFPGAPESIVNAFVDKQVDLAKAGILDTPERLAMCCANLSAETSDFRTPGLVENTNYTHARAAVVWPNRFASAADVVARYGDDEGWQLKMFDDIYGNRMGNRPGTRDGSKYIGRGGPQITGRDGYVQMGKMTGLPLEASPSMASRPDQQPAITAAFWTWKKMNAPADAGNFSGNNGVVHRWNGGFNGLDHRKAALARILPIARSLDRVSWSPEIVVTTGIIVGGGAVATPEVQKPKPDYGYLVLIAFITIAFAAVGVVLMRRVRQKPTATPEIK